MTTRTSLILKTMNVLFWILFIGLCIKTGAILYSYIISMAVNPVAAKNLYLGLNLSGLFNYGSTPYSAIVWLLIVLTGFKAYIGYWVVKIFIELKLDKPFSEGIYGILIRISRIALWAGIIAIIAQAYSDWLSKRELTIPIDWAYGEFLFFAGVIYLITLVFKKGTELQTENELTI